MNSDRQSRLDTLIRWWKAEIPKRVKDGRIVRIWDPHEDSMPALVAQSQKRWGVSISTARDYARVVYLATEPQLKAELKNPKR